MLIKHEIAKAWESEMAFEEGHKGVDASLFYYDAR